MKINISDLPDFAENDGGKFKVDSIDEAYEFCKGIALGHYENFPVGSILIPKKFRKYFFSVYAFSRLADDIADEIDNSRKEFKLSLLNKFHLLTENTVIEGNPVFMALQDTMAKRNIPAITLQKLLVAFKMDADFTQPDTYDDLLDYCTYSANPVGEIVLRIFDLYNDTTAPLSDNICTGLQLANFWQDISTDSKTGRIYIPKTVLDKYGIDTNVIINKKNNIKLNDCLKEIYDYTNKFFILGYGLVSYLKYFRLKYEIVATIEGGKRILKKTGSLKSEILYNRPELTKQDILIILIKSLKSIL